MANLNKVLLLGNLTRDPEVRYTPKGTAVGDLGLAVNRRVNDGNGNWSDEVTFVGRADHFQLWQPHAFAAAQAQARGERKLAGKRS